MKLSLDGGGVVVMVVVGCKVIIMSNPTELSQPEVVLSMS